MNRRPGLQTAWFLFVAVVAITLGIIVEVNRRENLRNAEGGILFILLGLLAIGLAAFAYLRRRRLR